MTVFPVLQQKKEKTVMGCCLWCVFSEVRAACCDTQVTGLIHNVQVTLFSPTPIFVLVLVAISYNF